MVQDARPVLIVMVVMWAGFGVGYSALLPRLTAVPEVFSRPLFMPFWQLLSGSDTGRIRTRAATNPGRPHRFRHADPVSPTTRMASYGFG